MRLIDNYKTYTNRIDIESICKEMDIDEYEIYNDGVNIMSEYIQLSDVDYKKMPIKIYKAKSFKVYDSLFNTLENFPLYCDTLVVQGCTDLKSLRHSPKSVNKLDVSKCSIDKIDMSQTDSDIYYIILNSNNIKSLEGIMNCENLSISDNLLEDLNYLPKTVNHLRADSNLIKTVKHIDHDMNTVILSDNSLTKFDNDRNLTFNTLILDFNKILTLDNINTNILNIEFNPVYKIYKTFNDPSLIYQFNDYEVIRYLKDSNKPYLLKNVLKGFLEDFNKHYNPHSIPKRMAGYNII